MGIVSVMMAVGIVVAFTIGWFFKGWMQTPTVKGAVYDKKTMILTVQWDIGKIEQFRGKNLQWERVQSNNKYSGVDIDTEVLLYEKWRSLTERK